MGLPKHRISKSRRGKRRAHKACQMPNIAWFQKVRAPGSRSQRFFCSNCNQPKPPHAVCPNCGHYRGRALIEIQR